MSWSRRLAGLLTVALVASSCTGGQRVTRPPSRAQRSPDTPNVVVVVADGLTVEMLRALPTVRRVVGQSGTDFGRATTAQPFCCAEATLLTGLYPHSHGVLGPSSHEQLDWDETVAGPLQASGYRTAYVGRAPSGYTIDGRPLVPPGWDEWYVPVEDGTGELVSRGSNLVANGQVQSTASFVHLDDAIGSISIDLLDDMVDDETPFYLQISTVAPGASRADPDAPVLAPVPADRHIEDEATLPVPVGEIEPGKPPWVAAQSGQISEAERRAYWGRALESLRAVDEAVASVVSRLRRADELDSTVILFTSSHGTTLGEHGLSLVEGTPYEASVRIPLFVRGPGFPAGATDIPVSHVDIAPTILRIAGLDPADDMEGVALQDALRNRGRAAQRVVLVEGPPLDQPVPPFWQVRAGSLVLTRYGEGAAELSDLAADPGQVRNLIDDEAYAEEVAALDDLIERLRGCSASECVVYERVGGR